MQKYVPESDEKKSSLEVSAEILVQIIVMFIGLLLIHRIITYIPTYSGAKYPDFHIVYIILAIFSALTVILIRLFIATNNFSFYSILIFIFKLIFVYSFVVVGYFYLIYKKISMATFYPIIKIIELLIPVSISVIYYKDKLIPINYIGIFLSLISIVCIEWKK